MTAPPCICPKGATDPKCFDHAPWTGHPSEQRVVLRMLPSPGPVVELEEPASGLVDVDSWINPTTVYHNWPYLGCYESENHASNPYLGERS